RPGHGPRCLHRRHHPSVFPDGATGGLRDGCAARVQEQSHGLLHDLQAAVTTTYSTPPGAAPHDTGQTMAFCNMQNGDAPLFKSLADQYTMSDNYHQPAIGGTGPHSQPPGFADQVLPTDGNGHPATPAAARSYAPDP